MYLIDAEIYFPAYLTSKNLKETYLIVMLSLSTNVDWTWPPVILRHTDNLNMWYIYKQVKKHHAMKSYGVKDA
jgi:hypothetical protein